MSMALSVKRVCEDVTVQGDAEVRVRVFMKNDKTDLALAVINCTSV